MHHSKQSQTQILTCVVLATLEAEAGGAHDFTSSQSAWRVQWDLSQMLERKLFHSQLHRGLTPPLTHYRLHTLSRPLHRYPPIVSAVTAGHFCCCPGGRNIRIQAAAGAELSTWHHPDGAYNRVRRSVNEKPANSCKASVLCTGGWSLCSSLIMLINPRII